MVRVGMETFLGINLRSKQLFCIGLITCRESRMEKAIHFAQSTIAAFLANNSEATGRAPLTEQD